MTDHDHITTLKAAADPFRVAAALGLRGQGLKISVNEKGQAKKEGVDNVS
jgi:hypothetical protein